MKKIITPELLIKTETIKHDVEWFRRNIGELHVLQLLDINDYKRCLFWLKKIVCYTFDSEGNPIRYNDGDEIWERTYNEYGSILTHTHNYGTSYEYSYDEYGSPLTYKNSAGYSCKYTCDKHGNILKGIDSNGHTYEYTYDDVGNRIGYQDNMGMSWKKTYDEHGNVTYHKEIRKDKEYTEVYYYDIYGRLIRSHRYSLDREYSYEYSYDDIGNPISFKDSEGDNWERQYVKTDKLFVQFLNGELEFKIHLR